MKLRSSLLLLLSLVFMTPAALHAKEPCDQLKGDPAKQYNALGDVAAERYGNGDYPGAIESILSIKQICAEDPRLDYNLARAYHRAENCNMARFWYEEVLARSEDELGKDLLKIVQKQKKKALSSITELEQVCANSSRVTLDCADDGVTVQLGDVLNSECPAAARVDSGSYELVATKEGYVPYITPVTLKPGDSASLLIPKLSEVQEVATTGFLRVSCLEDVTEVTASTEGQPDVTWPCPSVQELPPGAYTLSVANSEETETVEVEAGESTSVRLATRIIESDPIFILADADLRLGAWISLGTGLALLAGGIAIHLVAVDIYTGVANRETTIAVPGQPPIVDDGTKQVDAQEQADLAALLDIVGWSVAGVGGAALITGIVLLVVSEPDEDLPEVSTSITPDGFMFNVKTRW